MMDAERDDRYRQDLSLFLEVRQGNDGLSVTMGRRYAVRRSEIRPPEPPYHNGELRVTLSPEQAVEIIRTLWRQLPLEDRPCP